MLEKEILSIFKSIQIDPSSINESTHLINELGMDSQECIELHCAIEKHFCIKLPSNLMSQVTTFSSLLSHISHEVNASQGGRYVS